MTQYYSRKDYNYAGDSNFTIPFSYISKDDINVYVNDEAITTFTWLNDSQINITSALTTGDIISIRRNTPIDEKIVTYQNMSMVLNDDNLNLSQDQILDAVQEIYDNNVTFEIKVNNDIDAIETVANTALTNANTAVNTANSAETKANNAVSTANSADSKADNAVSTANTASNNATTAVNTANSAVNTANSASNLATQTKNRVDAFEEDIDAVIEAAEKIDELEEAVQTAVDAATTAGDKATIASNKATEATNAANRAEAAIPSQTGQNGKFLKTNGTNTSWETVDALPSQTGQSGKFLTTDGTDASWATVIIPTVNTDNITISKNLDNELQTVGVIDQNNTTNAIKTWTGTKAQYDAITTKDSNMYYTCTDTGEIYLGDTQLGGSSLDLFMDVPSDFPLTNAGLHLKDGALIEYGSYRAFVDKVAEKYVTNPEKFTTESNWQAEVLATGFCDKYVYDSVNNTVRLPKIGNQLIHNIPSTLEAVGNGNAICFTNGSTFERYASAFQLANNSSTTGIGLSFANANGAGNTAVGSAVKHQTSIADTGALGVSQDATKSGIVTKTDNINTADVYYYVVIATSTKTDIQVDIDEIATDLNGKADTDLTNCTDVADIKMAHNAMPSDTYIDLTLGASDTVYTAPANGWFSISKVAGSDWYTIFLRVLDETATNILLSQTICGYRTTELKGSLPVRKGQKFQMWYNATGATNYFRFVYAQGSESEAS